MSNNPLIRYMAASAGVCLALSAAPAALFAAELQGHAATAPLVVTVGKALVLDNELNIQRVSQTNPQVGAADRGSRRAAEE